MVITIAAACNLILSCRMFALTFLHVFPFNQVDMLSEINIAPRILTNFTGVMPSQFKKDLDSYLKTRSPVTFLSELRSNLQVQSPSLIQSHGDEVTSWNFIHRSEHFVSVLLEKLYR